VHFVGLPYMIMTILCNCTFSQLTTVNVQLLICVRLRNFFGWEGVLLLENVGNPCLRPVAWWGLMAPGASNHYDRP